MRAMAMNIRCVMALFAAVMVTSISGQPAVQMDSERLTAVWETRTPDFSVFPKNSKAQTLYPFFFHLDFLNINEYEADCVTPVDIRPFSEISTWDIVIDQWMDGAAERLTINGTFGNGASTTAIYYIFNEETTIEVADNYFLPVQNNTAKVSFKLENWPFASMSNCIELVTRTAFPLDPTFELDSSTSDDGKVSKVQVRNSYVQVDVSLLLFATADGATEVPVEFTTEPIFTATSIGFTYSYTFPAFAHSLFYDPDISILLHNEPLCPSLNECNSHGTCVGENKCFCNIGWTADDCATPKCPGTPSCSGQGSCEVVGDTPQCNCQAGWLGNECNIPDCPGDINCNGRGECLQDATCVCNDGWGGLDCSIGVCPQGCSDRGSCNQLVDPPQCDCNSGFGGLDCGLVTGNCTHGDLVCANGACNETTGECDCSIGFSGHECTIAICPGYDEQASTGNCNFLGACNVVEGTPLCACRNGWKGDDCSQGFCSGDCNGKGECITTSDPPACSCSLGWTGPVCAVEDESLKDGNGIGVYGITLVTFGLAAAVVVGVIIGGVMLSRRKKQRFLRKLGSSSFRNSDHHTTID